MASNEEVAAWLAANPTASDAEIAQAAQAAGVSAQQLATVTGVPVEQVSSRISSASSAAPERISGLPTNPYDPKSASLAYNQGAYTYNGHQGQPVWQDGQIVGYDFMQHDVTPGMVSNIKTDLQGNVISRAVTPEGESITFSDALKMAAPFALAAFPGLGATLGNSLGLSGTAANVVGGGLLSGATSAATGGDFVKGALTGGLGAYAGGLLRGADANALALDADIAGGMVPEFGTNAAYDNFMQSAMTPAAHVALQTQIASGNGAWLGDYETLNAVDALNGAGNGAWLGENVPSGIPEWDNAFTNAGGTFDPAYVNPLDALPGSGNGAWLGDTETVNAATAAGTAAAGTAAAGTGLTASQIANLAKAGISLAGLVGAGKVAANAGGGGGGGNSGAVVNPTQSVPTNSSDYYNQLQQYYNAYLPQTPRDVKTPLQNWYNSSYKAP